MLQTKLGRLFLKKKTARSGASQVEEVLVELTSARLIIRAKEEGHPRNEDPFIEEVSDYYDLTISRRSYVQAIEANIHAL